ncbi:SCO family protein [Lichenicola sp.]|uniref:SCO family protein n=1 Tax=Lichenicola sp. TaxID=2804529 RepID=UPI003AFF92E7
MRQRLRASLVLGLGLVVGGAGPDLEGIGYTQRLGMQVPATLPLLDEAGHATRFANLVDHKPTLLMLGYFACPALCGVVRDDAFQALLDSGLRLPRDYSLVFVSIDPAERARDAAAAKAADLARYPLPNAGSGWHFATADAASIERIEQAVGYHSRYDVSLKQFLHPAGLVVLTPDAIVSGYLLGVGYQPGAVVAALAQARSGTIGQRAPSILLLCFHYDPSTGRYSLAILKVLRLMGGLTLVLVLALLVLLHRRRPA